MIDKSLKIGGKSGFLRLFFRRMWVFGLKMRVDGLIWVVWVR